MTAAVRALVLGLALSVIGGCAATSPYMRPLPPTALVGPRPDLAQVIFIRPSNYALAMKQTILDHSGRYLGDSLPSSHFAVQLPPGRYLFVAWAENTAALQAELAAGKTYFVEVATRPGFLSARVHLLAITPRHPQWARRDAWLQETTLHAADHEGGQAYLGSRAADTAERLSRAREHLGKYDAAELFDRTITAADGI